MNKLAVISAQYPHTVHQILPVRLAAHTCSEHADQAQARDSGDSAKAHITVFLLPEFLFASRAASFDTPAFFLNSRIFFSIDSGTASSVFFSSSAFSSAVSSSRPSSLAR